MKKFLRWLKKRNEYTFVAAFVLLIWYVAPPLLRMVDPQAGAFGIEMLYVPLIAAVFFFVGLMIIWAYIRLVFPNGYNLLDELFEKTKSLEIWERSQLMLRLFGWLVVLYAVSLLAVTGVSAIM